MNTEAFLAAQFARPITHHVVSTYACGKAERHEVRSLGAAENYATMRRRQIGRDLIERDTGKTVRVVSVAIEAL
jgi:hypothetical protein